MENVNVVLRYEKPTCELVLPLAMCVSNLAGTGIKGQHPRHLD
jgi:hypothetical protein